MVNAIKRSKTQTVKSNAQKKQQQKTSNKVAFYRNSVLAVNLHVFVSHTNNNNNNNNLYLPSNITNTNTIINNISKYLEGTGT